LANVFSAAPAGFLCDLSGAKAFDRRERKGKRAENAKKITWADPSAALRASCVRPSTSD